MITNNFNVNADFEKATLVPNKRFVQGDTKSTLLKLKITRNSVPLNLSDVIVSLVFLRSDNAKIPANATITNAAEGEATYLLASNILNVPGQVLVSVALYGQEDERLTHSVQFPFEVVEETGIDATELQEDDRFPVLTQLISDCTEIKNTEADRVITEGSRVTAETNRETAESTRQSNETARESAETTRSSNESTRQTSETNRESVETTRVNAEATRESNENVRQSKESNRESAETNRSSAESIRVFSESTRNSNESTRQSNESIRQSAESTRQDNEVIRISQEANREASIADIENRFENLTTEQQQEAEVINARSSTTKAKTFDNLNNRIEDTEQDIKNIKEAEYTTVGPTTASMISVPDTCTKGQLSGKIDAVTRENKFDISQTLSKGRLSDDGTIEFDYKVSSITKVDKNISVALTDGYSYVGFTTDYISISESVLYLSFDAISGNPYIASVCYYDSSGAFISKESPSGYFTEYTLNIPIEAKEIRFTIASPDITGTFEITNVLLENTTEKKSYISTGTKSTLPDFRMRVNNKNKCSTDEEEWEQGTIDSSGNNSSSTSVIRLKKPFKVIGGQQINFSVDIGFFSVAILEYNNDTFVKRSLNTETTSTSLILDSTTNNVKLVIGKSPFGTITLPIDIENAKPQFENNTSRSDFTKHDHNDTYVSAPYPFNDVNGVKDEVCLETKTCTIKNSDDVLTADDIVAITNGASVQYVRFKKPTDFKYYNVSGGSLTVSSAIEIPPYFPSNIATVGALIEYNATEMALCFVLGTYADLTSARTALTGVAYTYQLADDAVEIIKNGEQGFSITGDILESFGEGTTFQIDPWYHRNFIYGTAVSFDNTILELNEVKKVVGTEFESIDIATVTIADDKKSITIPGASTGDVFFIDAEINSSEHAGQVTTLQVPINAAAQRDSNTDAISMTKKELDEFMKKQNAVNLTFDFRLTVLEP